LYVYEIVSGENLEIVQIDIKTTYFNADLDNPVFITRPEGFLVPGKEYWPVFLKKALYGTKEAPMLWNKSLKGKLEAVDFNPLTADRCAHIRLKGDEGSLLIVYVDDVIYASNKNEALKPSWTTGRVSSRSTTSHPPGF
jgi:hypothetical protein